MADVAPSLRPPHLDVVEDGLVVVSRVQEDEVEGVWAEARRCLLAGSARKESEDRSFPQLSIIRLSVLEAAQRVSLEGT